MNQQELAVAQERLHELGVPREHIPSSFRVSNNAANARRGAAGPGFALKFVEHKCYSIDAWDSRSGGHNDRMHQHRRVKVGDILWLPESRKNDKVYRGVVESEFMQRGPTNPSFYGREDVRTIAPPLTEPPQWPHWRDGATRSAWLEQSNEYICKVRWSEATIVDKTSLNEGFVAKSIVTRNATQVRDLDNQFV
jgi:hypothetical protein